MGEKPLDRPPSWIIVAQCVSGSGVAPAQSVKSGKVEGGSNPKVDLGWPFPSGPWQPTQAAL